MKKTILSFTLAWLLCGALFGQETKTNYSAPVGSLSVGYAIGNSYSSLAFQLNYGYLNRHLLGEGGLGLGIGFAGKTTSTTLRIPVCFGYMFGKHDGFHVIPKGGAAMNILLAAKYNKEKLDLSETNRISFNGSLGVMMGYGIYNLFTQYEFPFKYFGQGAWVIGVSLYF